MTCRNHSKKKPKSRRKKQTPASDAETRADSGSQDSTTRLDSRGIPAQEPGCTASHIFVYHVESGKEMVVKCSDGDQLMAAIKGTAKALDKAMLNIGKSRADQFAMTIQSKEAGLSCDVALSDSDIRVWNYCKAIMEYGGEIPKTQVEIARDLGKSADSVNRSFTRFRRKKMIEKSKDARGYPVYRVCEDFASKGKRQLHGTKRMADVIFAEFGKGKK